MPVDSSPRGKDTRRDRPVAPRSPTAGREPGVDAMQKRSDAEVIGLLRGLASGWSPRVQKSLAIPDELFFHRDTAYALCSSDESFKALDVLRALGVGGNLPSNMPEYAILITEKQSLMSFLLIDMKRRIIVHTTLKVYQSEQPDEWGKIAQAIDQATEAATPKGSIAVSSGPGPPRFVELSS